MHTSWGIMCMSGQEFQGIPGWQLLTIVTSYQWHRCNSYFFIDFMSSAKPVLPIAGNRHCCNGACSLWVVCQGPSHGGSYMDEGTSHIRIGLPPCVVSGDCLAFLLYASFIVRLRLSDVRWYRVVLVRRFLHPRFMYAALRAILLDHMYVHLHGSLYPMMDYTLHVYYRPFAPCLLMFHGVHYDSFTISYCTRFAVL